MVSRSNLIRYIFAYIIVTLPFWILWNLKAQSNFDELDSVKTELRRSRIQLSQCMDKSNNGTPVLALVVANGDGYFTTLNGGKATYQIQPGHIGTLSNALEGITKLTKSPIITLLQKAEVKAEIIIVQTQHITIHKHVEESADHIVDLASMAHDIDKMTFFVDFVKITIVEVPGLYNPQQESYGRMDDGTLFNVASQFTSASYLMFFPNIASLISSDKLELTFGTLQSPILGSLIVYDHYYKNFDTEDHDTVIMSYGLGIDTTAFATNATGGLVYVLEPYYRWNLHSEVLDSQENVLGVSKFGMVIQKQLFDELQGFDPAFGVSNLLQDMDLCLRARKQASYQNLIELRRNMVLHIDRSSLEPDIDEIFTDSFQERHSTSAVYDAILKAARDRFRTKWNEELQGQVTRTSDKLLVWDSYCSCTGLNIEAINFLIPLSAKMGVSTISGDSCFCKGFPVQDQQVLKRIAGRRSTIGSLKIDYLVSHKPPTSYPSWPYKGNTKIHSRPRWVIGRSMTESVPVPSSWVSACDAVDEVWVPTHFHLQAFIEAGVNAPKLQVIPESTDTELYDPEKTIPWDFLPSFESQYNVYRNHSSDKGRIEKFEKSFKFLSVFKWEDRKGWDILLRSYFTEFHVDDEVCLVLQTYLYGESAANARNVQRIRAKIFEFVSVTFMPDRNSVNRTKPDPNLFPCVVVLSQELDEVQMPQLYAAANAFVLPTRGEGWGLPIMEAMAMRLPTIATNWSGPSEFMTQQNSFPIPIDGLEDIPKQQGYQWAKVTWKVTRLTIQPSHNALCNLMRYVFMKQQAAKEIGNRAREHIVDHYSREVVANKIISRLSELDNNQPAH